MLSTAAFYHFQLNGFIGYDLQLRTAATLLNDLPDGFTHRQIFVGTISP